MDSNILGGDDTVRIGYEIHADDWHSRGAVDLPTWCSGSPAEAVSLYLFGCVVGAVHGVTDAEVLDESVPLRSASRLLRAELVRLAEKHRDHPERPCCDSETTLADWREAGF